MKNKDKLLLSFAFIHQTHSQGWKDTLLLFNKTSNVTNQITEKWKVQISNVNKTIFLSGKRLISCKPLKGMNGESSINTDGLTCNVRSCRQTQKRSHCSHFFWLSSAPHWYIWRNILCKLLSLYKLHNIFTYQ